MVAVLFSITLIASAGVGAVNMITVEPIAAAKAAATEAALGVVLPAFDKTESEELSIDEMPIVVYTATNAGQTVGYAVETMTKSGFSGVVKLMVGFLPDGTINNVNVLQQAETPGLGTKMCDEGNPLLAGVKGKEGTATFRVKKDGGEVDALTAATISSRAYLDAVNRACVAMMNVTGQEAPDGVSGATTVAENAEQTEPAAQEGGQNE
ncbi:MAG: RnfABCDGE type electron transport complex subunit G [Alistipes sp.]|nr:RnfABCDGE type electron transport complex subunit G [Alistipes sp.]MBQ5903602.1 RnfABCDGE type electron transport complex subunit G [Alistipes sp.]